MSIEMDSLGDDVASQHANDNEDKSTHLDDSITDKGKDVQTTQNNVSITSFESLVPPQYLGSKHASQRSFTHGALPADIAAACRAGEEMDRLRATQLERNSEGALDAGDVQKSPVHSKPFTNLFKSAEKLPGVEDDNNASSSTTTPHPKTIRHHSSLPLPNANAYHAPLNRRSTMEHNHRMPSEISVAETEKHANLRQTNENEILEDLSDDEEVTEGTSRFRFKKNVLVDPIVVEVPGSSRRATIEETKEEIFADDEEASRKALMEKAKKKRSMRKKKGVIDGDNDAFHFHGPKSVRKWVNRRRSNEEKKNQRSYVKGKVIDGTHELYTMSIAVMFGMRTSIGRTNLAMSHTAHNDRRWLDNDDMMSVEKYEFPPKGSDITPPHKLNHTFKFKDYSPLAFAYLRRMFGVNEYDFLLSVCGNANYIEFQSNAKSGQFFFYSPDGKYMIKTMTSTECKFLRRIMPHYFRHCAKNPNTLVTKFLGMYRVKLYHLRRNVKFVVMCSVYDTDKNLHQVFDVKGSSLGREAKPSDAVKKDNDIRRTLPDGAFVMEPGLHARLQKQVENDCHWLRSMKIMDYSMLIGVHNISLRNTKTPMKSVSQPMRVTFSKDDGDDRSNSSYDASQHTLDRFLDDDDGSYLDGVNQRGIFKRSSTSDEAVRSNFVSKGPDNVDDESSKESKKESDVMLEKAIEDMYWPFHRFYTIRGLRRMKPIPDRLISPEAKEGNEAKETEQRKDKPNFFDGFPFEKPLSYRKDGGFTMDTTDIDLPLKMSVPGAPHMAEYCDGKIIYIGVIDILQQFNIRKRVEARYRKAGGGGGGGGWEAASCVHPTLYADRFIRFFDEYMKAGSPHSTNELPSDNASAASGASNHSEMSSRAKRRTM